MLTFIISATLIAIHLLVIYFIMFSSIYNREKVKKVSAHFELCLSFPYFYFFFVNRNPGNCHIKISFGKCCLRTHGFSFPDY